MTFKNISLAGKRKHHVAGSVFLDDEVILFGEQKWIEKYKKIIFSIHPAAIMNDLIIFEFETFPHVYTSTLQFTRCMTLFYFQYLYSNVAFPLTNITPITTFPRTVYDASSSKHWTRIDALVPFSQGRKTCWKEIYWKVFLEMGSFLDFSSWKYKTRLNGRILAKSHSCLTFQSGLDTTKNLFWQHLRKGTNIECCGIYKANPSLYDTARIKEK